MIIRSQNKKCIVNLNNIDSINIELNHCGCDVLGYNGTQESCVKLGEYSTEAKAIKVLDMICKAYKIFCDYSDIKNNRLFEMPQDDEVN